AEKELEPLGYSAGHDYMGNVVQPVSCSIILFFASGYVWQLWACLAGWSIFMMIFSRYLHLRAVRRCYFTTSRVDTEALVWFAAPLSLVLASSGFWAARLRGWSPWVVLFAWIFGGATYFFLLTVCVRPLSLPKEEVHACFRATYDEVRARRFYDWHNCNPIKGGALGGGRVCAALQLRRARRQALRSTGPRGLPYQLQAPLLRRACEGRQPEEILAAASEAFCFWTGQKILEHDRRAADMDGQRARGAELRAAYKERASAARAAADGLKEENAVLGKCLKGALGCAERLQAEREQLRGRMAQLRQAGERRAAAGATWRPATAEDWAAAAPPRRSRGGGRGAPLLGRRGAAAVHRARQILAGPALLGRCPRCPNGTPSAAGCGALRAWRTSEPGTGRGDHT
ncbi:unnamed protein product, partial [Prorocentrum cordatum]